MLKKYRLCLTVVLVFALMGWFIEFINAEKNGYQTSLFGNLHANLGFKTKNLKPSVIRFVPKEATKIAIISTQAEPLLVTKLENQEPVLTTSLITSQSNSQTTLYIKSDSKAAFAHQVINSIRKTLPKESSIKISDFEVFQHNAKEPTYFYAKGDSNKFIDYQTIIEDADMVLWIGKY